MRTRSIKHKKLNLLWTNSGTCGIRSTLCPRKGTLLEETVNTQETSRASFCFENSAQCPENEIRPSLGEGDTLALLLRYGETPMQSRWKDTVKPVLCGKHRTGVFFLQYERVPHGTQPSVRPATVPWFRPLVACLLPRGTKFESRASSCAVWGGRSGTGVGLPHSTDSPWYRYLTVTKIQDGEAWNFSKQCSLTSRSTAQKSASTLIFCSSITPWTWKVTIIVEIFNLAQGVQKRNQAGKTKLIKMFVHIAKREPPPLNMKACMYSQNYFNKYWSHFCS